MSEPPQDAGGTPPPQIVQTNTNESVGRRRGGQPGNRNAFKHGRRSTRRESAEVPGGTPPPQIVQTNTNEWLSHGRGGQPGNRNALKTGLRTAQMRALRAEVRLAVTKARSLAKMAWAKEREDGLSPEGKECAANRCET